MSNINFKKIDSSDLDFNKIYTNSNDAYNDSNNVKVNSANWEEMDLSLETLDNGVQRIYNGDVAIGFTKINENGQNSIANEEVNNSKPLEKNNIDSNTIEEMNFDVNQSKTQIDASNNEKNYKYDDSNEIAKYAREMGMNSDQIDIAVGISRWETGNYKHLAHGFNYGGVTGNGDLGSEGGYAKYSSKEIGMKSYLDNLKRNYFDQGLNTTEDIARKYLGYSDTSSWIKGVNGCKK